MGGECSLASTTEWTGPAPELEVWPVLIQVYLCGNTDGIRRRNKKNLHGYTFI
jgi:hypothetical protein